MATHLGLLLQFAGSVTQTGIVMVAAQAKAVNKRTAVSQTVVTRTQVGVQAPVCRESLSLAMADCKDNACVHCEQVNDLFSLTAGLKGEAERLRTQRH